MSVLVCKGIQMGLARFVQASTTTTRPVAQLILNPNCPPCTPKLSSSSAAGRHIAPVPETLIVFSPLVLSEFTVIVPLYVATVIGENITARLVELPAAMLPLHTPLNPVG